MWSIKPNKIRPSLTTISNKRVLQYDLNFRSLQEFRAASFKKYIVKGIDYVVLKVYANKKILNLQLSTVLWPKSNQTSSNFSKKVLFVGTDFDFLIDKKFTFWEFKIHNSTSWLTNCIFDKDCLYFSHCMFSFQEFLTASFFS